MNDEWQYRGYTMKQLDEMIGRDRERAMIGICFRCFNFLPYCTCAKVTTSDHTTLLPSMPPQPAQTFTFVPQLTEEQVRKIVREEVGNALRELTHELNMQGGIRL